MMNRPNGPELDLLAEIVSEHDRRLDEAPTADEKEAAYLSIVNGIIPAEVLAYVAFHRAIRKMGATTRTQVAEQLVQAAKLSSAWIDGFTAGAAYMDAVSTAEQRL